MNSEMEHSQDIQPLIEQLSQAVTGIDKDDLVGLAKMHGWCEGLAAATGADAERPNPHVHERATSSGHALEALILGDAKDPDATVAAIVEAVAALAGPGALAPRGADAAGAGAAPTEPESSDEEVAAKLALVFEEETTPPEPAISGGEAAVVGEKGIAPAAAEKPLAETTPELSKDSRGKADSQLESVSEPPYESIPLRIAREEEEFVKGFVEEAHEHIEAIEAALLEVERAPDDAEQIDALFRPFHTIKGAAGFLNLRDIVSLTHEAETLLDQGRKGQRTITPGLIDLTFDVVDVLKVQIGAIGAYVVNPTGDVVPQPPVETMIAGLRDVVAGRVEPIGGQPASGNPDNKVGENLVEQGAVAQEAVDFAVAKQQREPGKKTGETLIGMGVTTPKQVSQALRPQAVKKSVTPTNGSSAAGEQSVRIDTAKLDALVDMVGELVIAQTQVSANPQVTLDPKLTKDVTQATKIVRDVQDVAMAMRMIPIGPTFQKMARLVRDVSRKVSKNVQLTISGEDTELDKNVIQQIADPLVHMVRNAVDHGIESPEVRRAAGKPEAGQVYLAASHQGGNIVIEIGDDGKGLDPKALIKKGIEKGVVQADENLSDQQAYQLIFAPGFSLAKEVTGISGRGVGMDVVRRNIEQLRGKVEITSRLGEGSTFLIQLPLTLAIIDGMILRVGTERFIIQTVTVEQALRPKPEQITTVQRKGAVLNVRGRLIPLVQLGSLFGLSGPVDPCDAIVVIAQYSGGEIGLVVEELLGQQQVVIKSLGERFAALRGVSGAAILGDGRVGLILEMSGLTAAHNASRISYKRSDPAPRATPSERRPSGGRPGDSAEVDSRLTDATKHLVPA